MTQVTADLDLAGVARILNVPDPTASGHAANKAYVDALKAGLDWKESARVASTANVSLAGPGASIDGVALNTGDRVLLKNQTAPAENGLWRFTGSGSAMTRTTDMDADVEATAGMTVVVEEGTANADSIWVLSTDGAIVVGTTGLSFSQLGTVISAGTGLNKTGNVIALDVPVLVANGGTGATGAAGARANLGFTTKYSANITGNGALTAFTVNHNLGTMDVIVQVYEATTDDLVIADVSRTDTNNVSIVFAAAPSNGKVYRVVVVG